jgi:hypothetical protein
MSLFPLPLPAPKKRKERVAAVARPRRTGNTLFTNLGWGGLQPIRPIFEKPGNRAVLCKTDFFSEPEKPGLSYSDVVDALSQRQVYAINLLPVQAKCSCVFF